MEYRGQRNSPLFICPDPSGMLNGIMRPATSAKPSAQQLTISVLQEKSKSGTTWRFACIASALTTQLDIDADLCLESMQRVSEVCSTALGGMTERKGQVESFHSVRHVTKRAGTYAHEGGMELQFISLAGKPWAPSQ